MHFKFLSIKSIIDGAAIWKMSVTFCEKGESLEPSGLKNIHILQEDNKQTNILFKRKL